MKESRGTSLRLICGALALVSLVCVVYGRLAPPTVTFVDSGELTLAAFLPGVAHPPGVPTFVMCGWLFSRLPLGSIAQRLVAMSIFCTAVAAVAIYLMPYGPAVGAGKKSALSTDPRNVRMPWWARFTLAATFAFSLPMGEFSTVVEVYTLNTALLAWCLLFVLWWRRRVIEGRHTSVRPTWHLVMAAGLYGLALGNHHVTSAMMGPMILWLLLDGNGRLRCPNGKMGAVRSIGAHLKLMLCPRYVARIGVPLLLGLSVYLYLPVVARSQPLLNWGDPSTAGNMWRHLSGKQYRTYLFNTGDPMDEVMARALSDFGDGLWLLARQFSPLPIGDWSLPFGGLIMLVGIGHLLRHDRHLLAASVATLLPDMLYTSIYQIRDDRMAYYMPAVLVSALWMGVGWHRLLIWVRRPSTLFRVGAITISVVLPVATFWTHSARYNRSALWLAQDYVQDVCRAIEPNGILLTNDWQLYSPWWYLHHVEGFRSDVACINLNLLKDRPWYAQYLRQAFPSMSEQVHDEMERFISLLDKFDRSAQETQGSSGELDPQFGQRISRRYRELLEAICNRNDGRPVYIFPGPMRYNIGAEDHLYSHGVRLEGKLVPDGINLRLHTDADDPAPRRIDLTHRGLNDGTIYVDVVVRQVRSAYATGMLRHAEYLLDRGNIAGAQQAYQEAAALDPDWSQLRELAWRWGIGEVRSDQ